MAQFEHTHKLLNAFEHLWPYISGVFTVIFIAGFKLWWSDRKDTKSRIKNMEICYRSLHENSVSTKQLQKHLSDIKQEHDGTVKEIFKVIREESKTNADRIIKTLK